MTTKRRWRHSPEQILRKLRDADANRRSCATGAALRRRNVGEAFGQAAGAGPRNPTARTATQVRRPPEKIVLTCSVENL
jgi:hypothetical protein